ncbi:calpain-like cysteine peptidase [Trypanosoma grayi]|uniref:calpain-like cysteine peptidase n=1 Tax=Trypanosoma grayi TaxID=71804 RepID=UPI0004F404D9|nr:calpain-like cysteine peptidase [Trypanosoma grayi]KEG14644.1 calpain-like cysteine peptidase [Trypanosoma grayi]
MASYYAGLSLREIYERKCTELQCRKNSAICHVLSNVPDEFNSLTLIDLSKNFLGPKGILPLLEIIRCCRNIRTLDLREQQLDNDAIDALCLALRQHPSVVRINLTDNPLTMSAGTSLLQLAKTNPVIEYIILDKSGIRPSLLAVIQAHLERNREKKDKAAERGLEAPSPSEEVLTSCNANHNGGNEPDSSAPVFRAAGVGKTGDPSLNGTAAHGDGTERKRLKMHDVEAALLSFSCSVHEVLFDENPVPAIAQLCEQKHAWFYDTQFAADDVGVQHRATTKYGISGWRRVCDIYPSAMLFPEEEEVDHVAMPRNCRPSFSWIFTCVEAVSTDLETLQNTVLRSHCGSHGVYGLRVHIDGAWRYVIVDDFLPVDSKDNLIFTQPVDGKYFWPCILEKALAKMHGGYPALDMSLFDNPRIRMPSQRIDRSSRIIHNLRARSLIPTDLLNMNSDNNNERQTNCSKTLSDLSGGVGIVRFLHHEGFQADEWWLTMLDLYAAGAMMVAMSGSSRNTPPGIEPRHVYRILQVQQVYGMRLIELSSLWASAQWKGDWSDESSLWNRHRDVDAALRGQRSANKSVSFWLSYTDFISALSEVHMCHVFHGFNERVLEGEWDQNSAGGSCFEHHWHLNPHYRLKITQKSPFFINLAVPDTRFTPTDVESLAIHILQNKHFPVRYKHDTEQIVAATSYVVTDSISFEGIVRAGDNYWVVPSSHTGGVMGKFFLRIFSRSGFIIWKEELSYHWNTMTYGDTVECSGDYGAGDDNAQLSLSFDSGSAFGNDETRKGVLVMKVRASDSGEVALGMFLVMSTMVEDRPSRSVGVLSEESIVASSSFVVDDCVYLEAEVSPFQTYTLVVCVNPVGSRAKLDFTIWSSLSAPRLTPLPVWEKKIVSVSWPQGSGSYYEVTRNPQVEIYPAKVHSTLVIRMQVRECSYTDPAIVFFVLANDGRQGEGIKGQIPADRVVVRSQYVRHHTVQCELQVVEPMDSLLVIPCLQPAGSLGDCTISVATESGDVTVRVLSTS